MRAGDAALRAIETAYRPIHDDSAWLGEILVALEGMGFGPWMGYIADGHRIHAFAGDFPFEAQSILAGAAGTSEAMLRAGHAPAPPVETARRKWKRIATKFGMTLADLRSVWHFEVPLLTSALATDAYGRGVFMAVSKEIDFSPRTKRVLCDVAAHVSAAHRLRVGLPAKEPELVCSTDGKLLDGSPTAVAMRESLAGAVKDIDRARGKLRRLGSEEAIERWAAMVEGRWTLVDRTERDGKRLVLGYRNEPPTNVASLRGAEARVATLAALGHSNKYIAYELGLKQATVASHLRRALAKLRLDDRRELVEIYGPLAGLSPGMARP